MKAKRSISLTASELLIVQDRLFEKTLTKVELARQGGISRQTVHVFLTGGAVDLGSAIKICDVLELDLFSPKQTIEKECATCKYWEKEGSDVGRCRRYPPKLYNVPTSQDPLVQDLVNFTLFPCTPSMQWCGEYEWNRSENDP